MVFRGVFDALTHPQPLKGNVIDLRKKARVRSVFLCRQTYKTTPTLAMSTKVKNILEGMKSFVLEALTNRSKYVARQADFTRNRTLSFNKLCFFMITQCKRSLSIELNEYFNGLGESSCTKGAFSKARYRVSWVFFQDWHCHLVNLVYANAHHLNSWKGLFLKAIDGTSIYLFKDEDVEKEFGSQSNQYSNIPMARAGVELDVLNGYCTQAQLQPYSEGESKFAEAFLKNATAKDLLIYDRLFANFILIFKHLQKEIFFLMRCKIGFNNVVKKFVDSGKKQCIVEFNIPKNALPNLLKQGFEVDANTTVKVRLIRIDIGQEEPEILITNLLDLKKYPHSCFKELYNYRWGNETKFDQIKNKFQIEIFSGHKPQAIYQDFFAALIAVNLHNMIIRECDEQLEKINKIRKIPVAINQNVSIGLLKPHLIKLFITKKTNDIIDHLKELFLKYLEPVRPGRMFPRTKTARKLKGKYQTFKNYRRAA